MADSPSDAVVVERDGHLAIVAVNRPSKLNALDNETIERLDGLIAQLDQDDQVGAIIITGTGEKAFVAGADAVMLGNLLAGVDEAPGELELVDGAMWKTYRGMGSSGAMRGRASDRYGTGQAPGKHVAEGVEGRVRYAGPMSELISQIVGGLRSGMGYAGAADLDDLRHRTRLTRITGAGLRESHPHDITVLRDE